MITPEKNPSLFRVEDVGESEYNVPIYHSMGLDGDVQSATYRYWREQYKLANPDDLKDGKIDNEKYLLWARSEASASVELATGEQKVVASILFYPIGNAPKIDSEEFWYTLDPEQFKRVKNFTKPTSQNSTDGQATSAENTSNSPASQTA